MAVLVGHGIAGIYYCAGHFWSLPLDVHHVNELSPDAPRSTGAGIEPMRDDLGRMDQGGTAALTAALLANATDIRVGERVTQVEDQVIPSEADDAASAAHSVEHASAPTTAANGTPARQDQASLQWFREHLRSDSSRTAIGLRMTDPEALRIAASDTATTRWYEWWLRAQPHESGILAGPQTAGVSPTRSNQPPSAMRHGVDVAARTSDARSRPPLTTAVVGLVVVSIAYFFTGTWLSLIALVGLGLSIHAITQGRRHRSRSHLVIGIIGTVVGAINLFLFAGILAGYGR